MMRNNNPLDLSLFLLIAKIGKTRGLRGEFFLRSFSEDLDSLNSFSKFYTLKSEMMEEVKFEYIKSNNSNITAKIDSINDIDAMKLFGQRDLYVLKSELPKLEENEAYWFELEGMEVVNLEGEELGKVDHVNNYGASDMLEVSPIKNGSDYILIPFIKNRTIIAINKAQNSILVDWQMDY